MKVIAEDSLKREQYVFNAVELTPEGQWLLNTGDHLDRFYCS